MSLALRSASIPRKWRTSCRVYGVHAASAWAEPSRSVTDAIGQFLDEYLRSKKGRRPLKSIETVPVQDTLPLAPGKKFGLCPQCGTWNWSMLRDALSAWRVLQRVLRRPDCAHYARVID